LHGFVTLLGRSIRCRAVLICDRDCKRGLALAAKSSFCLILSLSCLPCPSVISSDGLLAATGYDDTLVARNCCSLADDRTTLNWFETVICPNVSAVKLIAVTAGIVILCPQLRHASLSVGPCFRGRASSALLRTAFVVIVHQILAQAPWRACASPLSTVCSMHESDARPHSRVMPVHRILRYSWTRTFSHMKTRFWVGRPMRWVRLTQMQAHSIGNKVDACANTAAKLRTQSQRFFNYPYRLMSAMCSLGCLRRQSLRAAASKRQLFAFKKRA